MILTESDLRVAAQEVKSKNLEKSYISESTRFDAVEAYDLFRIRFRIRIWCLG